MSATSSTSDGAAGPAAGTPHHEASFLRDRQRIVDHLVEMARLVDRSLRDAIRALRERNRQLAYAVIIRDQAVDALERATAKLCLDFLVRQQPAGAPLRFAYTAIKVNTGLERVGDYIEAIAHQAAKLNHRELDLPLDRFQEIADVVLPMLGDAVRAFLQEDAALARSVLPVEDAVDQLKSRLREDLMQLYKENRLPFEALDPCLTITRRLERVSDQARNICVETLFLCTGELAQHPDAGTFRLLFLDQHNAGTSLMAECLAERLGGPRFQFSSAGLDPRPSPPAVVAFMREKGFDVTRRPARSLNEVPELDRYHVVAVLHPEAKKLFPRQAHKIVFLDWPVEDPATVAGSPEAVRAACERAFQTLEGLLGRLLKDILGETPA
ncbi:MAG: phosphate signaling complex protein PhoU [Verrucomicrobia bacterium]|nr:phosphate signaling complex protein PhoU [Verrucomicrobiota bacterium]